MGKLAAQVREKLAASSDIMKELQASSQHVLTNSVTALQAYEEGLQLARAGDDTQAVVKFEKATDEDPNFAMAYSQLAGSYANLHQDGKAYEASRRAMDLSQNLPPRDRYLIAANDARIANDNDKAIVAYENLTSVNPGDIDAQFALAKLYNGASNFDDARKRLDKVLAADPKNASALRWSGRVEIESGNPQAALAPLNSGLSLATQSDNEQEKGLILHYMGIAYNVLNRPEDALNYFQQALDIRKKLNDQRGIAMSLGQIARIQDSLGSSKAALANYQGGSPGRARDQ